MNYTNVIKHSSILFDPTKDTFFEEVDKYNPKTGNTSLRLLYENPAVFYAFIAACQNSTLNTQFPELIYRWSKAYIGNQFRFSMVQIEKNI